jgi:hypothetical protein
MQENSRLKAAPSAEGPTWQPIETIQPHDGEYCLTWRKGRRIDRHMFERRQIGWTWQGLYGYEPTHWMPLPTPPRDPAGKE